MNARQPAGLSAGVADPFDDFWLELLERIDASVDRPRCRLQSLRGMCQGSPLRWTTTTLRKSGLLRVLGAFACYGWWHGQFSKIPSTMRVIYINSKSPIRAAAGIHDLSQGADLLRNPRNIMKIQIFRSPTPGTFEEPKTCQLPTADRSGRWRTQPQEVRT